MGVFLGAKIDPGGVMEVLSDWPAEVPYTQAAISALADVLWTQKLVRRVEQDGGVLEANRPLLFEVRFAFELNRSQVSAEYEHPTSVATTSVDFCIHSSAEWLVELVSIRGSRAAGNASIDDGTYFGLTLASIPGFDTKSSEAGEMLLVQQKIGAKVYAGREVKFPSVTAGAFHMIVADMRGYLGGIPAVDQFDYRQIANGAYGVPDHCVQFWGNEPIKGLFELGNPLQAAKLVRERVHFLAFVYERLYIEGELREVIRFFANPHLFKDIDHAKTALSSFPIRKISVEQH